MAQEKKSDAQLKGREWIRIHSLIPKNFYILKKMASIFFSVLSSQANLFNNSSYPLRPYTKFFNIKKSMSNPNIFGKVGLVNQ